MELPVLIEPTPPSGFRATMSQPVALEAVGPTQEEALNNLRRQLGQRLQHGAQIVPLQFPPGNAVGILLALQAMKPYRDDDPIIQEWLQIIEENRRKDDEAEGIER